MFLQVVTLSLVLLVQLGAGNSTPSNEFERANGCQQYNTDSGYFTAHPYFDTSKFKNIKTDEKGVTRMRFGVLGKYNAFVRFTSVSTNSMTPMTEIALAHWWNTRSDVQKYTRTIPTGLNSNNLAQFITKGLMSIFKPVMITLEIHRGGHVTVTKDGEYAPFLEFDDPTFSYAYMGTCKWDDPVVLFYDCPLLSEHDGLTQVDHASVKSITNASDCNNCLKVIQCNECGNQDKCFPVNTKPNGGEIGSDNSNDNEQIKCF